MLELIQPFVGFQGIGVDGRSGFHVLADLRLKRLLLPVRNNRSANFTAAFQDSHDGGLVSWAGAADFGAALRCLHIAGLAADEGFVRFDFTAEHSESAISESEPQTVIHEPRGFLGHSEIAGRLARADAVFAVNYQPPGGKPFVQAQGGILEDGPGLERKCGALVLADRKSTRLNSSHANISYAVFC